ncbi:MAG TPA: flagellar biosynthesis anti-sigma factor FlgM [Gallionellaceae bacterium]|nr:flagellar biosynthesis anti-sigma factor FlgM [Gallionellaceae bacterium]
MKIDKTTPALGKAPVGEATQRNAAAKPALSQEAATSVNLGSASAQLRAMESSIASTSTVNAAKVAEIKQAISEGRFQVNAGAVADSLISSVKDMISAAQRR